jgi:hypothetical protein
MRPPRHRMIREPWAAYAAFPAGCPHESRKGEYDDRQQANCRQKNHSACGVKRGRHRGYARLVRSRRSSSERHLSPLSSVGRGASLRDPCHGSTFAALGDYWMRS